MQSHTVFHSARSSAYYTRLVSHFAHKITVTEGPEGAVLQFVCGQVRLRETKGRLDILASAATAEELVQTRDVLERHLLRFAFREAPAPLVWEES